MEDCSSYRRIIPNLHIRIVNEKTNKDRLLTKDTAYSDAIVRFVKEQTHINKEPCIFTYKLIAQMLAAEIKAEAEAEAAEELETANKQEPESSSDIAENEHDLPDDDKSNTEPDNAYLGNLRGLNDFLEYRVFCQIGLLRKPSAYYIETRAKRAYLLSTGEELPIYQSYELSRDEYRFIVDYPKDKLDGLDTVIVVEFEKPPVPHSLYMTFDRTEDRFSHGGEKE